MRVTDQVSRELRAGGVKIVTVERERRKEGRKEDREDRPAGSTR